MSHRGTGRARARGWLGPCLLPKRRAHLAHAGCRLRSGRIEVLWDRLEDCEAHHRARGGTIAHRHGPPAARERRRLAAQKFSHPFIVERDGVTWAFQHNGSLVNDLGDGGKIDSQLIFELLLERLGGRDHDAVAKATAAVRDLAIQKYGGFTALNFMLSDGRSLHAFRDFQTNGQYYTLYLDNFGEMMIAASEPILAMQSEPMPRGVLHTITSDLELQRTIVS